MKFHPKVSIIIPVYNGANYLRDAINSALNQTYKNIEIIVVNDGSNDNGKTDEIALSYGNKIKYIKKKNGGVASALNVGINHMTGEYFSWLSHDDLYTSQKIENQIKIINKLDDKKTIICCRHCVVNFNSDYMYEISFEDSANAIVYPALKCLFKGYIHGCGLLIHKSHFERVGLFDENLPTTQDYDLWFRMFRKEKIFLNDNLDVKSRCHNEQGSKKNVISHIKECDKLWINMVKTISDEEMIQISGSKHKFYKEIYSFLSHNTSYKESTLFIKELYVKELKKEIFNNKIDNLDEFKFVRSNNLREFVCNPKTKKRIVIGDYGQWADLGGLNRVIANISNLLCDYYEIFILANGDKKEGYKLNNKVKYINIDPSDIYNFKFDGILLLLSLLEVDIHIGVHNCWRFLLDLYKCLNANHIKNIAWNHEFYFFPYYDSTFYNSINVRNEVFKQISACFWLTSFNAKLYSCFADNYVVMPNPISWDLPENKKYSRLGKNIVSIGRFDDPVKCLDKLLKIFSLILAKEPKSKLYVIGSYNLNLITDDGITVEELIKKLKIPLDSLVFTGFIKNLGPLLEKMDINLITSRYEAFGLTINEAGSYKIPTLAFNDSGFEDLIKDGENGFLFSRNNEEQMAIKAVELLKNKKLCAELGNNAYNKCNDYIPDMIVSRWRKVLDKIIEIDNQQQLNAYLRNEFPVNNNFNHDYLKNIANWYEGSIRKMNSYYRIDNEVINDTPNKLDESIQIKRKMNNFLKFKESCYAKLKKYPILYNITRFIYRLIKKIINLFRYGK